MKHREEGEYPDFRPRFEQEVFSWPHVTTRYMFGCLAYMSCGKMFAFLQNESVVLTNIDGESRDALCAGHEAFAFESSNGKTVGDWLEVVISDESELGEIMSHVRKSYETALARSQGKGKKR